MKNKKNKKIYFIKRTATYHFIPMSLIFLLALTPHLSPVEYMGQKKEKSEPEAISLLGRELHPKEQDDSVLREISEKLAKDADDIDLLFKKGKALGDLGRYNQAIRVLTRCIELNPEQSVYYRWRGHYNISIRQFEEAIPDLEKGVQLYKPMTEEDLEKWDARVLRLWQLDAPYHLALAYYYKRDFENALNWMKACMEKALHDWERIAASYWLYLIHWRQDRKEEAGEIISSIPKDLDKAPDYYKSGGFIYHNLLLFFTGKATEEDLLQEEKYKKHFDNHIVPRLWHLTTSYGIGVFYLLNDQKERAIEIFERMVEGDNWSSFGFIAAEVELAEIRKQ